MKRVYVDLVADGLTRHHEAFLRAAGACGDALVAGVIGDDDAEWLDRRPGLPLDDRARAVAALPGVERVVAGAPLFPAAGWLSEQGIQTMVHAAELVPAAARFWYGDPLAAGMVRTVGSPGAPPGFDPHGRTHAPADISGARAPLARRAGRFLARLDRFARRSAYTRRLRRLADVLGTTPLAGRYWVVGGLLLGWARAGRPLDSDLQDADFAYLDADHERFLAAVPALARAGFRPKHRFSSTAGRFVEHRFQRGGIQYDFFRVTPVADRFRYSMFVRGAAPAELVAEVPAQERVPFRYLGREWRKVADHDLALRTIYGDWRDDRPGWSYTHDRAIVARVPMPLLPLEWNWPQAIARGPGERAAPA